MKKDIINIEQFAGCDFRVGKVLSAENVEGSEKLYKLQVDLGEDYGERTVLSGIRKWISPEQLVDHKLIFLANLAPRPMMGLESQGMMIATDNAKGEPTLMYVDDDVPAGSQLR